MFQFENVVLSKKDVRKMKRKKKRNIGQNNKKKESKQRQQRKARKQMTTTYIKWVKPRIKSRKSGKLKRL